MSNDTSNTPQDNKQQSDNKNEEIGALWKRTSRNNMTYLAGHVKVDELGMEKTVKVVVFSNQNKQKDNQPDYRVYISNTSQRHGQANPDPYRPEEQAPKENQTSGEVQASEENQNKEEELL
jgi:uncharacterized protein (DUF736 family)